MLRPAPAPADADAGTEPPNAAARGALAVVFWAWLPFVLLVAALGYVALAVRRTRRAHRARSDERAALLLAAMHGRPADPAAQSPDEAAARPDDDAASPDEASVGDVPGPHAAGASLATLRRPRFLTDPQRLLYLILRAALPDHVIMANTRMIDLLEVAPGPEALEHDARLRELLHQRLDCVVCGQDFVPLAAIVVHAAAMPRAPEEQKQAEALRELGIKFLRFRADTLPRPAQMRALVLS